MIDRLIDRLTNYLDERPNTAFFFAIAVITLIVAYIAGSVYLGYLIVFVHPTWIWSKIIVAAAMLGAMIWVPHTPKPVSYTHLTLPTKA